MSQNAKQKANSSSEINRLYSYTLYDYLGRITEVGQLKNGTSNPIADSISRDASLLESWIDTSVNTKGQITRTVYDLAYVPFTSGGAPLIAKNLRNRVAYVLYIDTVNASQGIDNFNTGSFYSYDILGNVDTLVQDYGSNLLSSTQNVMNSNNIASGGDGIMPNR